MTASSRLPASLASARPLLSARVFGMVPDGIGRQGVVGGAERDFTLVSNGPGELFTGAVIEMGDERLPVTPSLSEFWRKEPREVMAAAFEESARRAQETDFSLRSVLPGTYRSKDAGHPPLLLNNASLPSRLTVNGEPVLLIPTADTALFTGSEDLDGLRRVAEMAWECMEERPADVVTASPIVWRSGWESFAWPSAAAAQRRDRRRAAQLTKAVDRLNAAFQEACDALRTHIRAAGLPIRRYFGSSSSDQTVLDGWARLSVAFGLDEESAARVREAAADTLTFYDANEAEITAAYGVGVLERQDFRAEDFLALALSRSGSVVVVGRNSDLQLIAEDAAASPAARAAGAVITLADDYDHVVEIAEDVSERMRGLGVEVVVLGDAGEDLRLVFFSADRRRQVRESERAIGDPMLLTYL